MVPLVGDVVLVSCAASVQFVDPFLFRITKVHDWPTYDRWLWIRGYVLDVRGEAVDRRDLYVQPAGLRRMEPPRPRPARRAALPRNRGRFSLDRPPDLT